MVGTRDLAKLAYHTEAVGAKLVLVGDDRQLPEINAGGAFRGLADRVGALELREVRRQAEHWDREALLELRDGNVREWALAYRREGRIVAGSNAEITRDALVGAWWRDVQSDPLQEAVMVALRRRDVSDLNERARAHMRAAGALGCNEIVAADRAFAIGDHIVTATNDRILAVANGERGRVSAVDGATRSVRVRLGNREIELPARYLDAGSLDHGYAMTAHRLQGATVDRAHVLGSDDLYREWGYTALSRHRETAHFYVTAPELQEPLPGMDDHDALDGDMLAPLRREKAKALASDLADHDASRQAVEVPRREVAVGLLESMSPALRDLPVTEELRAHVAAEHDAALRRLKTTEDELGEVGWLRGQERRSLERRVAAQRSAADHWATELARISEVADAATRDAATWFVEHAEAIEVFADRDVAMRTDVTGAAHFVQAIADNAHDGTAPEIGVPPEPVSAPADFLFTDVDLGP